MGFRAGCRIKGLWIWDLGRRAVRGRLRRRHVEEGVVEQVHPVVHGTRGAVVEAVGRAVEVPEMAVRPQRGGVRDVEVDAAHLLDERAREVVLGGKLVPAEGVREGGRVERRAQRAVAPVALGVPGRRAAPHQHMVRVQHPQPAQNLPGLFYEELVCRARAAQFPGKIRAPGSGFRGLGVRSR